MICLTSVDPGLNGEMVFCTFVPNLRLPCNDFLSGYVGLVGAWQLDPLVSVDVRQAVEDTVDEEVVAANVRTGWRSGGKMDQTHQEDVGQQP